LPNTPGFEILRVKKNFLSLRLEFSEIFQNSLNPICANPIDFGFSKSSATTNWVFINDSGKVLYFLRNIFKLTGKIDHRIS